MMRRFTLAMAVLGAFLAASAGNSQAGWGGHSETSAPGATMSSEEAPMNPESETSMGTESEPAGESTGAYEEPTEGGMRSSGYDMEVAVPTGRLPWEGERETGNPSTGEFGGTPFRLGIDDGP